MEKQRICALVGPESTGKTTLAKQLAKHLQGGLVPEYARQYLYSLGRPYGKEDLKVIAKGQFDREQEVVSKGHPLTVCDTDLTVIKVWSEVKYKECAEEIEAMIQRQPGRKYLLTKPDLPWQADPQRENPLDREWLFTLYEDLLRKYGADYEVVEGIGDDRFRNAVSAMERLGFPTLGA